METCFVGSKENRFEGFVHAMRNKKEGQRNVRKIPSKGYYKQNRMNTRSFRLSNATSTIVKKLFYRRGKAHELLARKIRTTVP